MAALRSFLFSINWRRFPTKSGSVVMPAASIAFFATFLFLLLKCIEIK